MVVLPDRGGNQLVATAEAGGKLGARRGMHLIVGASEQPAFQRGPGSCRASNP